jgi:transposase
VLGVDDFAFAKEQRYGTILIDLEHRIVIDLLADREAKTLATWLTTHPGIEIVSRDRSSTYAQAVKTAASGAIQVADRFHLKQNLREATEGFIRRHYPKINSLLTPLVAPPPLSLSLLSPPKEAAVQVEQTTTKPKPKQLTPTQIRKRRQELLGVEPAPRPLSLSEQKKAASQARRMQLYGQI